MKNKPLYILTYDHGGFVLWGNDVKPRLKELVEWMEKYPKLKVGLDYESFTFDEYSKTDPEIIEIISYLLEKYPRRFGLGATTYGQPLSLFISEESNVRQLTYAVKTNLKHFGQTPNVYAISEFALNNQTPQLTKLCGYDAAILRSHVMGYGYTKNFDLPWGRWIGKDKTEIPAVPTYEEQGRGFNCTTLDNWIMSRWPREGCYWSLEDFEKKFEHISPLLASRYDDLTQDVKDITEYIETKDDYHYVLLEDLPELFGEAKEEIITDDNDFHVQMPWGYCGNEIFNGCRASEVLAVQAEKLNALAVMLGGNSLQDKLEQAWKYALVAQHHDVTICGLLDLSRRFIPDSLKLSEENIAESKKTLIARFADKENESVLIVNPNSFDIDEWVETEVDKDVCVYDAEKEIESEIIEKDGSKFISIHAQIPAFSVKRFLLREGKSAGKNQFAWSEDKGELITPVYKVKLTDAGISYIEKNKDNSRVFDNGDGELFTAYVDREPCVSKGKWKVNITSHSAIAVQSGKIGSIPYDFEMRFSGAQARIDCKVRFEIHNQKVGLTGIDEGLKKSLTIDGHRHEEKLNFIMNVCVDNDRRMVRDLPFSISDWKGAVRKNESYWYPEDDIRYDVEVSHEESFNSTTYMQGVYWLALRDKEHGVAVINRGCMGSVVQGNRLSIPLVYADSYMCGTKMLDGIFDDEFSILPLDENVSDSALHKQAMSYNYQPTVVKLDKGNGDISCFEIADSDLNSSDVILTSIYPEDGAVFARFCNYSDDATEVKFNLSASKGVKESDLLGKEIADVNTDKISFRPWEIKTLKFTI